MRIDATQSGAYPTYVIDGYNVIRRDRQLGTIEGEQGLEEGRRTLLTRIRDSRLLATARVIVVFDGTAEAAHRTPSPHRGLDVVFSLRLQNADQKIVSILKSRRNDGNIVVVTADQDLQWEVRKLGARVVDPADFISQHFATRKRPIAESTDKPTTTAEDVTWGLKTFGDETIKIEAPGKTSSPVSTAGPTANVEARKLAGEARKLAKERNKKRYLRRSSSSGRSA